MTQLKEHSDLIGGSIARRRLHCHGSFRLSNLIPASVRNKSSPYADEGTACHHVVEQILNADDGNVSVPDDWIGSVIKLKKMTDAVTITKDLVSGAIQPCIDLFDELDRRCADEGGLYYVVEVRCQFPGIPGAFGTLDILARTTKRTILLDWKFGVGVSVKALYDSVALPNGALQGEPNEQLMFYATSARHSYPDLFEPHADWPIELYIVQPRSRDLEPGDPIYSHVTASNDDLDRFAKRMQAALPKIKADDAPVNPGDWCNFCPAIVICPAKLNPGFEVAKLAEKFMPNTKKLPVEAPIEWGDLYSKLLDFGYVFEDAWHALQEQAHTFMDSGGTIKHYKLVQKRATEKYVDEQGAVRHVIGLGADVEEIYTTPSLKTPPQLASVIEPLMQGRTKKDRTAEARQELEAFTEKVSSGTTLAHDTDSRDARPDTTTVLQEIAERLKLSRAG